MEETPLKDQLAELIESHLEKISLPEFPKLAYDPFRYILSLGGKRIRPYLVLLGCGLENGDVEEAIPAAISVELLHNFTLVHDDIMDKADTRRGEASVHAKWNEPTGILAGDLIFCKAFQQLQYYAESEEYDRRTANAINQSFFEAVDTVCEGQALDLEFASREDVKLDEYLLMIERKTAYMLGSALYLGGLVAGANKNRCQKLQKIGKKAGIAFQIQDDMLDVTGSPEKFGKQVGGDIREGKKTYLSILASEKVDKENKKFIYKVLRQQNVDTEQINQVIELYKEFHIIDQTRETIQEYYQETKNLLDDFADNKYKSALYDLINSLQYRER